MNEALRRGRPQGAPAAWLLLGLMVALSFAFILWMGRETTLFADDLEYFAHLQRTGSDASVVDFGVQYVFAPFNGHLQAVGKLVYEAMFSLFGSDYLALRALEAALWGLCVILFFAFVRPLVGEWVALPAAALLLFLGSGWEAMLWAFDMHTVASVAAGLGALLMLRRSGWLADAAVCLLLVIAVCSIEFGLAFVVGAAVAVLQREDRWARIWIVAVPLIGYLVWTAWAQQYDQDQIDYLAAVRTIVSVPSSLSSTIAALTGLFDPDVEGVMRLGSSWESRLLAVLVAILFVRRIASGPLSRESWATLATLLAFWGLITIGSRPADQSRYAFAEAVLLLVVVAGLMAGTRFGRGGVAVLWVFVLLALPTNVEKLDAGRDSLVDDAVLSRSEYAMIELARDHVDPTFSAIRDENVTRLSDIPFNSLTAGQYLPAADRYGGFGFSLEEVRALDDRWRIGADATLVGALALEFERAGPPADRAACTPVAGSAASAGRLELTPGGARLRAAGQRSAKVGLTRFSNAEEGVPIGRVRGNWRALEIPLDPASATDPWTLITNAPLEVCPNG